MKNIIRFFNTVIIAGVVILLGTAGICDNTYVELAVVIKRVAISGALILSGAWGRHTVIQTNTKMKKRYKDNLNAAVKMIRA